MLNEDRTAFLARQTLRPTGGPVDVFLRVRRFDAASDVVFQTWETAEEGLIQIDEVKLFLAGLADTHQTAANPD